MCLANHSSGKGGAHTVRRERATFRPRLYGGPMEGTRALTAECTHQRPPNTYPHALSPPISSLSYATLQQAMVRPRISEPILS